MTTHHLTILTGASRGMGLAIARQLIQEPHARLLCISRTINPELADQARHLGAQLEQWPVDLAEPQVAATQLRAWLANIEGHTIASATLINNAALISKMQPLRDADAADVERALQVGLTAPMLLSAAFLGATQHWTMPRKVLNISSGLGRRAMASSSSYCAAKAGMDHFSRSLALEEALLPHGAKVCSLAPGVIDTDMQAQLRGSDPSSFPDQGMFASLHSQKQLTSPSDAAGRVIAFLRRSDFGDDVVADVRG